ncbi:hypothetical protein QT22_00360, partial [Staphylococcus aureus]
ALDGRRHGAGPDAGDPGRQAHRCPEEGVRGVPGGAQGAGVRALRAAAAQPSAHAEREQHGAVSPLQQRHPPEAQRARDPDHRAGVQSAARMAHPPAHRAESRARPGHRRGDRGGAPAGRDAGGGGARLRLLDGAA